MKKNITILITCLFIIQYAYAPDAMAPNTLLEKMKLQEETTQLISELEKQTNEKNTQTLFLIDQTAKALFNKKDKRSIMQILNELETLTKQLDIKYRKRPLLLDNIAWMKKTLPQLTFYNFTLWIPTLINRSKDEWEPFNRDMIKSIIKPDQYQVEIAWSLYNLLQPKA